MIIFGKTQDAFQTPFDATNPAAIAAGISSTDVFNAIIESKQDSLNNDRYPVFCSRNGNTNANVRLQIWAGIDSNVAPLILPEASRIVAYSFGATAAATGSIAIRNITTNTVLVNINFSAQTVVSAVGLTLPAQPALSRIEVYVASGSFNRPFGVFWLNPVT